MQKFLTAALLATALVSPIAAYAGDTPAPETARASFANLKDGDKVKSPFKVSFAVTGLEVVPAGTEKPNAGHFHLLVDTKLSVEEMKVAIPNDPMHLHYGKAQTETELTLQPGKHTLQIVMGDAKHELHNHPVMSQAITVTVE